jgi:hypothetical protein
MRSNGSYANGRDHSAPAGQGKGHPRDAAQPRPAPRQDRRGHVGAEGGGLYTADDVQRILDVDRRRREPVGGRHSGAELSREGWRRRNGYDLLTELGEAVLIEGGRWIWRGAIGLFLLVSAWNVMVTKADKAQVDPFASIQRLDLSGFPVRLQ